MKSWKGSTFALIQEMTTVTSFMGNNKEININLVLCGERLTTSPNWKCSIKSLTKEFNLLQSTAYTEEVDKVVNDLPWASLNSNPLQLDLQPNQYCAGVNQWRCSMDKSSLLQLLTPNPLKHQDISTQAVPARKPANLLDGPVWGAKVQCHLLPLVEHLQKTTNFINYWNIFRHLYRSSWETPQVAWHCSCHNRMSLFCTLHHCQRYF